MPLAALKLTPDGRTAVYARGTEANGAGEIADPTSGIEKRTQASVGGGHRQRRSALARRYGLRRKRGARTSRFADGEFAVWSAKKQLWIAPISGKDKAKALTFARGKKRAAEVVAGR